MGEISMQEHEHHLALEIAAPVILQEWQHRATDNRAWGDYMLLINACAEAIRRAPFTLEECAEIDIAAHLNTELALLSDVLHFIFPDGVVCTKVYK